MRQALHIFRKDVRYLRLEIALFLILIAAFAYASPSATPRNDNTWVFSLLIPVWAVLLTGRAVLAEELPGDRQFWITRPYHWCSLLGAKLLFIAAFINLPLLLAHVAILLAEGFPLLPNLTGLIWSQVLFFLLVGLPAAALAAVSSGLTSFVFVEITLLASIISLVGSPGGGLQRFGGAEWLRDSLGVVLLAALGISILYWQYKRRASNWSRVAGVAGLAVAVGLTLAFPWTFALAVQSRLSIQPQLGASLQASVGRIVDRAWLQQGPERPEMLYIPIAIRGIPPGTDLRPEALFLSLEGSDGRTIHITGDKCSVIRETLTEGLLLEGQCTVSSAFIGAHLHDFFRIRGAIYVTLFGNPQSSTIPVSRRPRNVSENLQCYTEHVQSDWNVFCKSALRWPEKLIFARLENLSEEGVREAISYSPFPGEFNINPISIAWASAFAYGPAPKSPIRNVTFTMEEPLVHLRRDFERANVRLGDLTYRSFEPGHPADLLR